MDLDHNKSLKGQTKNEVIDTGIALKDDPEYAKVRVVLSATAIAMVVQKRKSSHVYHHSVYLVLQNAQNGFTNGSSEECAAAR